MFEQLRPRRVEVERRANVDGDFLKGWDADAFDTLKFSYGLTGVDQVGNFLWVDTFLYMLAGMAICLLVLRIANMWWRPQSPSVSNEQPLTARTSSRQITQVGGRG
ncbi:hypothetical protein BDV95DRAFT_613052 [Massariosphaeria phaeospora]|uniref:Uncharacterized protein n=1 Tax=Massariosphaeria phaeospora TaxID=100035 RepID=A0A7C8HYB6_9PLEO|nr:hypothetical protein BDV95DRAFT_613052 [Massariosphaeria phaeospora]